MSHLKKQKKNNGRKSGKGGKRILLVIVFFILILGIASLATSFAKSPGRSQCKELIEDFQTACNNLDISGMVNCLKPSLTNNLLKLGTAVAGEDALDAVLGAVGSGIDSVGVGSGMDVQSLFQSIKLEPKKFGFPRKTRVVRCRASFGVFSQYVDIQIVKYYGDPYITKIKFVK